MDLTGPAEPWSTTYMELRQGWNPPKVDLRVISSSGGLGDMIARLPAIRYVHETFKHVALRVYWPDYFVDLAQYLLPETPRLSHARLSSAPFMLPKPYVEFDPDRITSLSLHLTNQAFLMLTDSLPPSPKDAQYPLAKLVTMDTTYPIWAIPLLQTEFVVITCGYTSRTRQWPSYHINSLAVKIREAGLTPVLLGTNNEMITGVPRDNIKTSLDSGIDKSLFVDLTNKTSLIEALGVMQRAKAVVGVDNGLLHLAHCTDVPVVYGFTTLLPEHRVPSRSCGMTEVMESLVPCKGCQSRGTFINNDWRTCIFDDYACTMTMTSDRFMAGLTKLRVIK